LGVGTENRFFSWGWRPFVVGPVFDRQMRHRRQQILQDLAALLQNPAVQAATAGRGSVDDLATEHIDSIWARVRKSRRRFSIYIDIAR
jgi:hypothetical protein